MKLTVLFAALLSSYFAVVHACSNELTDAGIVASLKLIETPQYHIHVTYPNDVSVDLGNPLTQAQIQLTPSVKWHSKPGIFYTLVMVDPTGPTGLAASGPYWNWMVVNIRDSDVGTGDTIMGYRIPVPTSAGVHNYVFLVIEQDSRVPVTFPTVFKFQNLKAPIFSSSDAGRSPLALSALYTAFPAWNQPKFGNFFSNQVVLP